MAYSKKVRKGDRATPKNEKRDVSGGPEAIVGAYF